MINSLKQAASTFPDKREGKNLKYSFMDVAMGAFSVFFTQSSSFLAHQRVMQESLGSNNANSLFGVIKIPTDNHIRDLLDEVEVEKVLSVFDYCLDGLIESGYLDQFRVDLTGTGRRCEFLVALDGTQYFSSESIHCECCSTKEHKEGVKTYSHTMITPVIVAPGKTSIIPLSPEYITPQDGDDKQDCENKACKRWLRGNGKKLFNKLTSVKSTLQSEIIRITTLGDDLYSRQPVIEDNVKAGFSYIFVCKEDSHPYLTTWIKDLELGEGLDNDHKHQISSRHWTGKYHEVTTYTWANHVPLTAAGGSIWVNWCEITITREETGKLSYHNAFVTDHRITAENVALITAGGRSRWKVENENNNTLKTKGYHLEHNYGHGKKHLSKLLATFAIIAYLFHTVMDLTDNIYQILRSKLGSRENFFNAIKQLTTFLYFKSWEHLFNFMIEGLKKRHLAPG